MFDYKLLAALAAVIEQGGFERAAQVLGLSQSAISQRIKLLEARVGQPVLVRATPPSPTEVGRQLLNHVQQVRLLERDLQRQVPALDEEGMPERLRIALNADSLATWWAGAVGAFCAGQQVLLDLVVEDQDVGLKRMRAGEVAACLCGSERPVAGARSLPLGAMRYRALASPAFMQRYFAKGVTAAALATAPMLVFNRKDALQARFVGRITRRKLTPPVHWLPEAHAFVMATRAGLGWGMTPDPMVQHDLEAGTLVELIPGKPVDVPLYWQSWRLNVQALHHMTDAVQQAAGLTLLR